MDALINIKGAVFPENAPPDVIELVTTGRYTTKNGKKYISYQESEATGLDGVTTTLKVEDSDTVTLIRTGASNSRLIISKGQRQLCHYGTGYGDIMVGISGCQVNAKLDENGGELLLKYSLDVNSSLVSRNEIFISVREANKQDVKSNEYSN
ncbi:MAG TPA: DUF1934 domain-containing protein [Ruminiclostridium sp.]|nr:DUF1934 domain-containing protein [Ruminiclostridium sp.]